MSTRRSSVSSQPSAQLSRASLVAGRHSVLENTGKSMAVKPQLVKKRPALTNLTNQKSGSQGGSRTGIVQKAMVPCETKVGKMKKEFSTLPMSRGSKLSASNSFKDKSFPKVGATALRAPHDMECSLTPSNGGSISLDESMSVCDSLKSPEYDYMDNDNVQELNSIERKTCNSLNISDHVKLAGEICRRHALLESHKGDKVINVDANIKDPQYCASIASEIYENLRDSEGKKRPATDFMDRIQKDITASMRAILIDWLVEVAEEYRLLPDTLFLTINYIDRYLSGNTIIRQRLQLLGIASMMIAAKYHEICAPHVEEFCYITDNTYLKDEVLQMESAVLNSLKFEMTAPTPRCFLRRFVRAAEVKEVTSVRLECMANYITELSLLEYGMLSYAPSLIAASATFLAKFILLPSQKPWTSTLRHYTLYKPSELYNCVKTLHRLCCDNCNSGLSAIREKYSQHKVYLNRAHNHLLVMSPENPFRLCFMRTNPGES